MPRNQTTAQMTHGKVANQYLPVLLGVSGMVGVVGAQSGYWSYETVEIPMLLGCFAAAMTGLHAKALDWEGNAAEGAVDQEGN